MVRQLLNNHTKQALDDACVHDWYRFVLAYPGHLVTDLIGYFNIQPGQMVLDPFVGTGTTLVECKKRGIDATGLDTNPVTSFASRVKTTWDIDLREFDERRRFFLQHLGEALNALFPPMSYQLSFGDLTGRDGRSGDPIYSEPLADTDAMKALIPQGALSDLPLRKLLVAKQALELLGSDSITDLLLLALISVAVSEMSNLGFGPEVYVKHRKKEDADLYTALSTKLQKIRDDLALVRKIGAPGKTTVYTGDARKLTQFANQPVDFVITSPPYPNEKDYTRTTRLELVLLEFIRDRKDLRQIKETMLRSHTRNIFEGDNDSRYVADIPEIQSLAEDIERKRKERGATSGFERLYHRVVTEYFGGMYRVLEQLQQILPAGGKLALVVGDQMSYFQVPIRTAQLLSLIGCHKLQYKEIETRLWRTRLATATRQNVEEHILILERC